MCRQIVGNKKGFLSIDKYYGGLEHFISWLVFERGGSGNGIILIKNNKIIKFNKNTDLSIEEISNDLRTTDYDYALFHTRLATVGSVCRSNVHPFVFSLDFALAMNGGENCNDLDIEDKRCDMTDAELIAKIMFNSKEHPKEFLDKHTTRSAYTGVYNGKPYVYTQNDEIMMLLKKDDAFLFSSEFPWQYYGKNIYNFDINKSLYWEAGMDLPTNIKETFDASKLINGEFKNETLLTAIKKHPEYKEIVKRVFYQFDKEIDTAETVYALDNRIKQEDIDRKNILVKTLFKL